MQDGALSRSYNFDPVAIYVSQLGLIRDAFIQDCQSFLISGTASGGFRKGGGFFPIINGWRLSSDRGLTQLLLLRADLVLESNVF
jgi:hypothetical protein